MHNDQVSLSIGGRDYYGWLSVAVDMDLQSLVRSFSVSITTKGSESHPAVASIRMGDEVSVRIGNELVLSGYITKVSQKYSGSSHQIDVAGHSKTVDLVDCTIPDGEPLSYKNQLVTQVLASIIGHYGIGLVPKILKADKINFDVSPEETIKDALEKLIKTNGLLLTDDASGRLVLTEIGEEGICNDKIQLGVNVLSASRELDGKGLFSRYVILGQGANPMSERPTSDNQLKAVADDLSVRHRVKTVAQTGNADLAFMQARASMMRDQSRAQSEVLKYTVRGWRQSNGELWPLNSYVLVDDAKLGVNRECVIAGITFSLGANGMTTTLKLKQPEEFISLAIPSAQEVVKSLNLKKVAAIGSQKWTDH